MKDAPSKMKPLLHIEQLTFSYSEEKQTLKNIELDIFEGEKIAVVGSNGSGKSTFFLNLNGVLLPDEGNIFYREQKITQNRKDLLLLRKAVGIVFQDPDHQIIASTVLGEVSFGPMNLRLPKAEVLKRVEKALEFMDLSTFKDRAPHYLSGGEKKRVTIADILAMESELIIFDEPTSSLDPFNRELFEEVLNKLAQDGKTLILSSHDSDFVYRWADRVLVFCDGEIIADDSPAEIFQQDALLERAHLKKPILLDVFEVLTSEGLLEKGSLPPQSLEEFRKMLKGNLH